MKTYRGQSFGGRTAFIQEEEEEEEEEETTRADFCEPFFGARSRTAPPALVSPFFPGV